MTTNDHTPSELLLSGYMSGFTEGFALPCYISNRQANVWYVATCSVNGDHDGTVVGFQIFDCDEVHALPDESQRMVSVGAPWQDVFLWRGKPYVGRPAAILQDLSAELEAVAVDAPISLLDLALSAGKSNLRPLVEGAFEHINQRYGKEMANIWLRDILVRDQTQLDARRHIATLGYSEKLLNQVNQIKVQKNAGKLQLILPNSITSVLGRAGQLRELEDRIRVLSDRTGTEIHFRLNDDAVNVKGQRRAFASVKSRADFDAQLAEYKEVAETSQRMADKMRDLARTDVVTGLSNRAGLNHEMVEKLMTMHDDQKLALFWIDLDKFKEVNDTLGHPVGDRVLSEVARRLRETSPDGATVARFGGDEFIVVSEVASRSESERLAGSLLNEISRPYRIHGEDLELGTSMGIALMPDDGTDLDAVMQSADLALYHAKVDGRNQIRFFEASMTRDLMRRKEIEADLRTALQRNELSIFFQPIVDLETGRIKTFEALVRWFHPEKGELRPDEFIPVAEDSRVIFLLETWVIAEATKAAAAWPEDVTIAINLSPLWMKTPGSALGILNALKEAKLDPSRLELEVTESLFLEDNHHTARFIEKLAAEGVRFALDDFGTGYSSLGYINKFPFKKIKVDRSFVSGPNVGRKSDAIIRAVAELGSRLEMDIVAEGLETIEQVRAVRDAGCTLGQGYYFSRAVPDYLAATLLAQERAEGGLPIDPAEAG